MQAQIKDGALIIARLAICLIVVGCDQQEPRLPSSENAYAEADAASSGTVFDLSTEEKTELEALSKAGDGDASFRISQYYSLGGGDDGQAHDTDVPTDAVQNQKWLELATSQGHETAKLNLAVLLAERDCARAVTMMREIVRDTDEETTRRNAESWLQEAAFQC